MGSGRWPGLHDNGDKRSNLCRRFFQLKGRYTRTELDMNGELEDDDKPQQSRGGEWC